MTPSSRVNCGLAAAGCLRLTMGAAASTSGWGLRQPEAAEAFKKNVQITLQIKSDGAKESMIAKLLLLGK